MTMTEYLHRTKNESRRLEPGKQLVILFDPGGRGDVRMTAALVPRSADPKTGKPTPPQTPPPLEFKLELRGGHTPAERIVTGVSGALTCAVGLQETNGTGQWKYLVSATHECKPTECKRCHAPLRPTWATARRTSRPR